MQVPVQITFRDIPPSLAMENRIRDYAARLERFSDRIVRCRVVVETPHRNHQHGNLFHVRIDLSVPGGELVVNREPQQHRAHEDAYVAIRDAFEAAERQLEDHVRRRSGRVKSHNGSEEARIARVYADDGYGFISTVDGREIYFHRNSVTDGKFDQLSAGAPVQFVAVEGESANGPQATTVKLMR